MKYVIGGYMKQKKIYECLFGLLVLVFIVYALFPVFWMIITSLKPRNEIVTLSGGVFPQEIELNNYVRMWSTIPLLKYIANGFITSFGTTILSLFISIPAAYAVSRYNFKGRKVYTMSVLATQLFPGIIILIPLFVLYTYIGRLTNINFVYTYHGVIIAFATFGIPYSIWMLKSYFDSIPIELDQSARIDGCNQFTAMTKVVLPVAVPGIVATSMYVFLMAWNNLLFASVLTNQATRTFTVGITEFSSEFSVEYGQLMAACTVATIPLIMLFAFFQRSIVSGMTGGAVKE